jgi:chromosomal replication initiator protein
MNSFEEIFALVKANLVNIGEMPYKSWIEPIKALRLEADTAVLQVPAPFVKQILEQNYTELFKKHLKDILGFEVKIDIRCDGDYTPPIRQEQQGQKVIFSPIPELQDDIVMVDKLKQSEKSSNYQHTFDTFIVGDSNKLAYSASKATAQGQNNYNPLYIYGNPGLGKTHLLSAVKNEISKNRPELNIVFMSSENFVNEFIASLTSKTTAEFKSRFRSADVLLLDDVQFFSRKEESQQELFATFNELHANNKQIILTSDRVPKEIVGIEDRLRSRFEWGLLADISYPEFETRLAIIQRKANLFGLKIPDTVLAHIAEQLKTNIRQLEGAITKMNALSLVSHLPPTLSMAKGVIKEVLEEHIPAPVTVERIINEIASIYGFTPDEIRSKKRSADISTARQIAIFVVFKTTGLSYVEIGKQFGGRDHSTIVYAINKVTDTIQENKAYRHTIEDLIKNVNSM